MSSNENQPSPSNRSPGKGGKSLELMQQRMRTQSQTGQPAATGAQDPNAGQAATASSAPGMPPAPGSGQPSSSPTSGRPKGKDFAQMSAKSRTTSSASPTNTMQQSGKPKGKDFSAMASRMGGSAPTASPQQQQQPAQSPSSQSSSHMQTAQATRAANLQAAARAAAGLPPLDRPTATSITTVPPSIPPPNIASQQSSGRRPSGAYHQQLSAQQQSSSGPSSYPSAPDSLQPRRSPSMTQQQQQQAMLRTSALPSPISASAAPPVKKTRENSKSTPTPTAMESRVAWQTSTSTGAGAHMAPLVGQRIQELVKQIDPNYTMDAEAEEQVLQLADDFLDKVCKQSLRLAQHRGSKVLDVSDVQLVLAKQWNIVIPGLGPPVPKKPKNLARTGSGASHPTSASNKRKASIAAGQPSKLAKTSSGTAVPGSSGS